MADSESILQLGIEAARAGDKAEARELFRLVTREDPNNHQGWLWLAGVAEDREEKRAALERVIAIAPDNELARRGLAALGGATVAAASPSVIAKTGEAPPAEVDATPAAPAETAPIAQARSGARLYDAPEPRATLPADESPVAVDDAWATPTYDPQEYDLQDYEQSAVTPAPVSGRGATVVVEDEEPRRGGLGWLPIVAGVAAVLLLLALGWSLFNNNRTDSAIVPVDPAATDPAYPVAGAGLDGETQATSYPAPGAAGDTLPLTQTDTVTAETTALPAGEPIPAEVTAPPAAETVPATIEETAPPPVEETTPAQEATPAISEETIVVVPPGATVAPTPETPGEATTVPGEATTTPSPPGDVAAANPAIVPNDTVLEAGPWGFTYGGVQNIATGSYGGGPATRGQYQIVLLAVVNRADQPTTIPDGFLVMKDAQGRVYDFNRAASVEYFTRFGGAGVASDVAADAQFPNNNTLTTVPLLFDVPPDATNLVLFSRDNLNQGFVIR